eukprot:COSAG05_NODE_370_length_10716_cov_5.748422_3_plen_371_part_00
MSLSVPLLALAVGGAHAATVTLSNVKLPVDQNGEKLITGEADILRHDGAFYMYFNNWGTCPGVDCCKDPKGCATCCFDHPPTPFQKGCEKGARNSSDPYGNYHSVQAYRTTNFVKFENLGVALPIAARKPGIEFRPHVIYNNKTKLFLMWFEDRGPGLTGYTVATSTTPQGPFSAKYYNVKMPGRGRTGDYDIFVDDDGSAYHVRTGFDVAKLNDDYTGPASSTAISSFTTPKDSEGPVMFKRHGIYYVLAGTGCCACIGGSTIYVMMADSITGPWTYAGDVGSKPAPHVFDPHSPDNYVTKAQASFVFEAGGSGAATEYVWCGNQWNSGLSETPPGPRMHDLLYWTKLNFNTNGTIQQVVYSETCEFDI